MANSSQVNHLHRGGSGKVAPQKKDGPMAAHGNSGFSDEQRWEIAEKIADKLREGKLMPDAVQGSGVAPKTGYYWEKNHEAIGQLFRAAREQGADALVAKAERAISSIQDDSRKGAIIRAREKAHHYRWLASKLRPKVYNDRMILSGDDDSPLTIEVVQGLGRARVVSEQGAQDQIEQDQAAGQLPGPKNQPEYDPE